MNSKFFAAVKKLIRANGSMGPTVAENLSEIANSVNAKQKAAQQHNEKARNAIDRGTKITKHRIPL